MTTPPWKQTIASLVLLAICAPASHAAVWYLNANQTTNSQTWNTMSYWKPNANGTGTSPSALNSADTYYVNGFTLRSPNSDSAGTATQTFGGGTLVINGNGTFAQKSQTAIIANLISEGGNLVDGTSSNSNNLALQVTSFTVNGATTVTNNQTSSNYTLSFATLAGSGGLTLSTAPVSNPLNSRITFTATNASGYTGLLTLGAGTLDFNSTFTSGGGLQVNTGTNFILDQTLTFTSFTIGSTVLTEGTYLWSDLKTSYAQFANSTAGSITVVPEPQTWLLLLGSAGFLLIVRARRRSTPARLR